jgi:uncharacterized protein (DUF488 family)
MPANERITIWTVGHSTRSISEFLALLGAHEIQAVADIRQFPGSRRYPQFGKEQLDQCLTESGILYRHFPELGGRRRARVDSPNTAWRNASFRGYADYMMTEPFRQGIDRLLGFAAHQRTAIMCAEAVWWRCHRALISDFLKARSVRVMHILSPSKAEEHPFTSAARLRHGKLSYGTSEPRKDLPAKPH